MAFAVSRKALNVQAKKAGSKTTKVCILSGLLQYRAAAHPMLPAASMHLNLGM
jgi:hypothetical protein